MCGESCVEGLNSCVEALCVGCGAQLLQVQALKPVLLCAATERMHWP